MNETSALLHAYTPWKGEEQTFLERTIAFLEHHPDDFWKRSNQEGHLTGSAWIVSADGAAALLVHHRKLDRWLQPGGHVDEADSSIENTARREAMEECGIDALRLFTPGIFDIDIHEIPARGTEPAHLHYDLRFLFSIPEEAHIQRNLLETNDIAWVPLHQLCSDHTPLSLRRMALKCLK